MADNLLHHEFTVYSDWRRKIIEDVLEYRHWLDETSLNDAYINSRLDVLLEKLNQDKLRMAFVAEFSRGKSELINAIFFSNYGRRLLPSSVGRTTMCPTEIFYDATQTPSIRLLPIETCLSNMTTSEYKHYPERWQDITLDVDDKDAIASAFQEVSQVKRVSALEAETYGLFDPINPDDLANLNSDGTVDIPRWRYAMINFPHPLLEDGLVIFDTPGLNAVGTEPELTLNLLPNAHAVLFVLCADTGVTKSESDIWHRYIAASRWKCKGRLAVLNKIDTLWDEHGHDSTLTQEINKQIMSTSQLLDLPASQIFSISAKKGLLAKIDRDNTLLHKSRLPILEKAITEELLPAKREIVGENTLDEMHSLMSGAQLVLEARLKSTHTQVNELASLQGKNVDLYQTLILSAKSDKQAFESALHRFQVFRTAFSQQVTELLNTFSHDALKEQISLTRQEMRAANFTVGLCHAMDEFFKEVDKRFDGAEAKIAEIKITTDDIYQVFSKEHGLTGIKPLVLDIGMHRKELVMLERIYAEKFNTPINMIVNEKSVLISKFFETLASRVIHVFELVSRDLENWAQALTAPIQMQLREAQLELRKRLEGIDRMHRETDTLEDKISALEEIKKSINAQLIYLNLLRERITVNLSADHLSVELAA